MAAVTGPIPPTGPVDPVLRRREQIRRLTDLGQKVGYLLFGVAILLFVAGFATGFPGVVVTLIVACLLVGSVILAPAIVFAYAVKAADREDREAHGG
jgi:hypothetical protein